MQPDRERDLLIAYALLPFLTPNRTRLLRSSFDPLSDVCQAPSTTLATLLGIDTIQAELVKNPLRNEVQREIDVLRDSAVTLLDDDYPALLREIIDPPLALFYRGRRELLTHRPLIAVVGSRHASPYGINAARFLAGELAAAGVGVVSGLAHGIDGAAHEAALDAPGPSIGVIGTGVDIVYPRHHRRLFERMEEQAVIISEFPPGTPPLAPNFPMRNRVISGLCEGTIIVEATGRSGSLITARMAAEQGRDVFAVPGSIFSAGAEGTNRLIQYGAKLVHDIDDVLEELPGVVRAGPPQREDVPADLRVVLETLARDESTHVEVAAAKLNRAPETLSHAFLQLELGGWIRALPGSRYVRVK